MKYLIDSMTHEDWEQVKIIFIQGIETGNATFQDCAPTWEEWDEGHIKACRFVVRDGELICGWAALSLFSKRECFSGVAEVSIYIRNEYKGKGIGRRLLESTVTESEKNGFWTLYSGIFPENKVSLSLHKKCGFNEFGTGDRIGRTKDGKWRDVVYLVRRSDKIC